MGAFKNRKLGNQFRNAWLTQLQIKHLKSSKDRMLHKNSTFSSYTTTEIILPKYFNREKDFLAFKYASHVVKPLCHITTNINFSNQEDCNTRSIHQYQNQEKTSNSLKIYYIC